MPGVTITKSGPQASRIGVDLLRRRDDAVEAGVLRQARQRARPDPSATRATPTDASVAASMLVSTVTRDDERRRPGRLERRSRPRRAWPLPSWRAPPVAWTLTIHTPRAAADATPPATVFGMSWNLRSRNTRSPRSTNAPDDRRVPPRVNSWMPILKPPTTSRAAGRPAPAPARRCRRRARPGWGSCGFPRRELEPADQIGDPRRCGADPGRRRGRRSASAR